jgi:glycosyltransferase involved in cell wall biosynthesis
MSINSKLSDSISVVIPVYNESENIEDLYKELSFVLEKKFSDWEIIFVDDGSTDDTRKKIKSLESNNCKNVYLCKNYGQTIAMRAGLEKSRYNLITFIDGDGQNDPNDISSLYKVLRDSDLDCICGWRQMRKDNLSKRVISRFANILKNFLIPDGIHDSGCTLKILTREAVESLNLYGELHRFIPSMLVMNGFKVGEIAVNHRARIHGKTKYNWRRTLKGLFDMFGLWFWNRYASRPLHFFGAIAFVFSIIGTLTTILTLTSYLFYDQIFSKILSALSLFLFTVALQFFTTGLIADRVNRIYLEKTSAKLFFQHDWQKEN